MTWGIFADDDTPDSHIFPVDEFGKHHMALSCPCNPVRDTESIYLISHNSFDGRELTEKDAMHVN